MKSALDIIRIATARAPQSEVKICLDDAWFHKNFANAVNGIHSSKTMIAYEHNECAVDVDLQVSRKILPVDEDDETNPFDPNGQRVFIEEFVTADRGVLVRPHDAVHAVVRVQRSIFVYTRYRSSEASEIVNVIKKDVEEYTKKINAHLQNIQEQSFTIGGEVAKLDRITESAIEFETKSYCIDITHATHGHTIKVFKKRPHNLVAKLDTAILLTNFVGTMKRLSDKLK